jgi:hypothetical protein
LFEGIVVGEKGISYRYGQEAPSGSSMWSFSRSSFALDPDEQASGYQNLIGLVQNDGQVERTFLGTEIKDCFEWQTQTRKVKACVYYFTVALEFKTTVDEQTVLGLPLQTEKGGYWKDFSPILVVRVVNWNPEGDLDNFAWVAGVEVMEEKNVGGTRNVIVSPAFAQGYMLPMCDEPSDVCNLPSASGVSTVSGIRGRDLLPDTSLRDTVYVRLHYAAFGTACCTNPFNQEWDTPQHFVKLRIHVVKASTWKLLQSRGGDAGTSTQIIPDPFKNIREFFEGMVNVLALPIGVAIGAVIMILVAFFAVVMGAFALAVRRRVK